MHNRTIETQGKCRRLFYAKISYSLDPRFDELHSPLPEEQVVAGTVIGVASGGGVLDGLSGDDLVVATFNDHTASERIGCIEEFHAPIPSADPLTIDLTKVQACCDAIDAHRAAKQAEADFVFEKGITLFGSESPTTTALRHVLKVQEMHTRNNPDRVADHDAVVQAQTDLEALCKTCEDCCEQVLVTRDAAITFKEREA